MKCNHCGGFMNLEKSQDEYGGHVTVWVFKCLNCCRFKDPSPKMLAILNERDRSVFSLL